MSLIINDFEIVTEPPNEDQTAQTPSTPPSASVTLSTLRRMIKHMKQRQARIRAD